MRQARLMVIVSGMMAGDPGQGGATWAVLQYVLGLKRLGHEVYLIEPLSPSALRPAGASLEASENAGYFRNVATDFGLEDVCSLILEGTTTTVGLPYPQLRNIARKADALLNISGMLQRQDLLNDIPVRIYLDLDPAFNQLWHATQGIDMRFAAHNRFVTVGNALGRPECPVPTCDVPWITTFQPVVLEYCPIGNGVRYDGLTTVANWRGYGSIQHDGIFYGQKAHSLREFMDLPAKTSENFILALAIHADERKDLDALARHGWKLLDPAQVAKTPGKYRDFIRTSKAEFGIAKSGYVAARCGWFSDRSACYLASGRPVIAQETGFSAYLPCGAGLFSFRTQDEVVDAIERVNRDYDRHAGAARAIANEYFDSAKVLSKLIAAVGL
jgi:hypothetical protein